MICSSCGADVEPSEYCCMCGALLRGRNCAFCGARIGVDEEFCSECGMPISPESAQRMMSVSEPTAAKKQPDGAKRNASVPVPVFLPAPRPMPVKKAMPKPMPVKPHSYAPMPMLPVKSASAGTKYYEWAKSGAKGKHAVLRGLFGGLVALAAIAAMIYFYIFGNLLTDAEGVAYSPLIFTLSGANFVPVKSFSLLSNFNDIIVYFTDLITAFSQEGAFSLALIAELPSFLFLLVYLIGLIFLALGAIYGIVEFLVGLFSRKEFDIMTSLSLAMYGYLAMLVALGQLSVTDGRFTLAWNSGLMLGIYAGLGAFVIQILLNLTFAGRRFGKGGAVVKWLTNLIMLASIAIMLYFATFAFIDNVGAYDMLAALIIVGGVADPITMICVYAFGGLSLLFVFLLPLWSLTAARRAARTFKFDGYFDKPYLLRGFFIALLCNLYTASFMFLNGNGELPINLLLFMVGAEIFWISAIINRITLNKDQR